MTIVTAVTPNYLDKLKATLPTWVIKRQFRESKLRIFSNEVDKNDLKFVNQYFKNAEIIEWSMPKYDSKRELMLSAFVLGVADCKSDYIIKLDADAYFTDDRDVFTVNDFTFDVYGHGWKYTKPSIWVQQLDIWANSINLPGKPLYNQAKASGNYYLCPRFASWCCLHKFGFLQEAISFVNGRLPIPSHDTYLWYLAERLPHRSWSGTNLKNRGLNNKSRLTGILKALKK